MTSIICNFIIYLNMALIGKRGEKDKQRKLVRESGSLVARVEIVKNKTSSKSLKKSTSAKNKSAAKSSLKNTSKNNLDTPSTLNIPAIPVKDQDKKAAPKVKRATNITSDKSLVTKQVSHTSNKTTNNITNRVTKINEAGGANKKINDTQDDNIIKRDKNLLKQDTSTKNKNTTNKTSGDVKKISNNKTRRATNGDKNTKITPPVTTVITGDKKALDVSEITNIKEKRHHFNLKKNTKESVAIDNAPKNNDDSSTVKANKSQKKLPFFFNIKSIGNKFSGLIHKKNDSGDNLTKDNNDNTNKKNEPPANITNNSKNANPTQLFNTRLNGKNIKDNESVALKVASELNSDSGIQNAQVTPSVSDITNIAPATINKDETPGSLNKKLKVDRDSEKSAKVQSFDDKLNNDHSNGDDVLITSKAGEKVSNLKIVSKQLSDISDNKTPVTKDTNDTHLDLKIAKKESSNNIDIKNTGDLKPLDTNNGDNSKITPGAQQAVNKDGVAEFGNGENLTDKVVTSATDKIAPLSDNLGNQALNMGAYSDDTGALHTLRVSSLFKRFGHKKVVQGIDFSMHTGEVLGLLGPNGAGKTTTFYMIVGFYQPSAGDIFLDSHCITSLPMYKRARLGISYLPQEPSVFKKLTVEENIWSILETRRDLDHHQKKIRLEELIEEFAIGRIRKQFAFTLSGGERRRTEIARSLAIEPKFLLLDEPFAGIDPIAVADIKGMIALLAKRDIGILITDHNVRDTLEITDRAIIVSTGQIAIAGTKQDILNSQLARDVYLGKDFSM